MSFLLFFAMSETNKEQESTEPLALPSSLGASGSVMISRAELEEVIANSAQRTKPETGFNIRVRGRRGEQL